MDMEGWTHTGGRIETSLDEKGKERKVEFLAAEYLHEPTTCAKCGVMGRLYRHGTKVTTYADVPAREMPTKLEATVRRYRCRDCGETFLQPLGGVLEDRRMTERCADYIAKNALEFTFALVAKRYGVDEKTVRAVAAERMEALTANHRPKLPRVLGIDETKVAGELRLVLTDVERRKLLDMLPGRDKDTLATWLGHFKDRSKVEVVTIDMWRPYQRVAADLLPGAVVVVDKFHILRMASEAVDRVRIRLAKGKQPEERRLWMRSKVQLLKRPHRLTEKQRFNLGMWLDNEPEIAAAYKAKEAFYSLFDLPRNEAIQAFDGFAASVPASIKPDFRELLTAARNWREHILAVFDHPFTNAYTESLNNLTKHIVKAGRGYSFEVLRARILASYAEEAKKPLRFEFLLKNAGNPCGNCGLPCRAEDMHPVTLPPMVRGQRAKRALVCALCEARFNTETLKAHRKPSTQ